MNIIILITIIFGALMLSTIMAYLIVTILYIIARVCGLGLLIAKSYKPFNKSAYTTSDRTQKRGYREYIKYSIRYYPCLFFRDNCIANAIFDYLNTYRNSNRNYQSNQDIINLPQIPSDEKSLNGVHAKNLSQGNNHVNHKQTEPFAMRYLGLKKWTAVAYLLSKGNEGNDCISEMKFVFDGCFKIDLEMVFGSSRQKC